MTTCSDTRRLRFALAMVVLASAGCAAGPESSLNTASWRVSGTRSSQSEHDQDENYVNCTLTDGGLLDMTSSVQAGVEPWLSVGISYYGGPRTFDFEWSPGPLTGTADVYLPDGYSYWFFYHGSFATEIHSTCTMDVSEPVPGARIHAEIACTNLVAKNTSPDYDDENPGGAQPTVSLTATFDCDI